MFKDNKDCTGCSACVNICPNGALKLVNDEDGFYKPELIKEKCTNCGLCSKVCPLNGVETDNFQNPKLYAFNNFSENSKLSATAGGFQIIAKNFIKEGGKVAGAVWGKSWRCEHVLIDNLEDLKKIYKSKYVQSYMGDNLFKTIKQELENGVKILFSGVPCQIAGLYNFLQKNYDNLYVIDILCNNAPSPKHFEKFLDEKYGIDNISEIDFRFKDEIPTRRMLLKITTKDGASTYDEIWSNGTYYEAFCRRILIGEHCGNCHFARLPRLGDITLGDIFGAEQIDDRFIGLNAESVIVNSFKGEKLFEIIKSSVDEIIEVPLEIIKNMHPVLERKWEVNPNRDRLFDLLKKYTFQKACDYAINDRYDIGLVGIATNPNYGGGLTYLALKHVLEDMGKQVLMISPSGDYTPWLPKEITNFKVNPYKDYELIHYPDKNSMRELNLKCDMFLVGSDQLYSTHFYNNGIMSDTEEFALLDWVWDSKKKSAYSASFGSEEIKCPPDMKNRMKYHLKKFDSFSVREKNAVDLCKKEFCLDVDFVLDPVFLCDKDYYYKLTSKEREYKGLNVYVLDNTESTKTIINQIADNFSYKINILPDANSKRDTCLKMEEWLRAIQTADFIVTDSFHGTCFSIIFNKPFITIKNKYRGSVRFDILKEFNLENRLVDSLEDFENRKDEILSPINWEDVNSRLEKLKTESLKVLKEAISPKEKESTDYEMLGEKIYELNNKINNQLREIDGLKNSLNYSFEVINQLQERVTRSENNIKNIIKDESLINKFKRFIRLLSVQRAQNKLNELLKNNPSKRIVFWGASLFLEGFIRKFNIDCDNIVAIVDKDPSKSGKTIGKYKILSPDEIKKKDFDCFIMTIKHNNRKIYKELKNTIKRDFKGKTLLKNVF